MDGFLFATDILCAGVAIAYFKIPLVVDSEKTIKTLSDKRQISNLFDS